jgi:NADH-quinone oxidoreductase subunit G
MRVLPSVNEAVNEEWISDKTRHACDGLMRQRLDRPYVRERKKLRTASWAEAFEAVAARIKAAGPDRIGVIAGDLQDAESMKAALDLFSGLGVTSLDCRQDGSPLGGARESYLFNSTFAGLEQADAILLIGCNPRLEAPVLNARIRKMWLKGGLNVGVVGEAVDLTYPYAHIGAGPASLAEVAEGKHSFARVLKKAANPAIILGQGALARKDGLAVLELAARLASDLKAVRPEARGAAAWNGFNVLHTAAARVGGLDLGFVPGRGGLDAQAMVKKGAVDVLFLLGADEIDLSETDAFVVYLGTHGDRGAHRADVILPGAAYTEKPGLYVNSEGRVQLANRAVFPKGEAREDWAILRALSERIGARLAYDSLDQLRSRLFADHPSFGQIGYAPGSSTAKGFDLSKVGRKGRLGAQPFACPITDFYQTNPIARASVTMAECSALVASRRGGLVAAE